MISDATRIAIAKSEAYNLMRQYKKQTSNPYCGEIGQQVIINNQIYYIGDVVKLTDKKKGIYSYYQLVWGESMFTLLLHNPNNALASEHPHGVNTWIHEAYIPLFHITERMIPYAEIERVGNSNQDLKLIKRIRRKGLKPY